MKVKPQTSIIDSVSSKQLMTFTENITKEIRLSGSEEELRAFQYIEEILHEYGIETALSFHDAYISFPGKAELMVNGESLTCITHSMAAPTDGLTGEVVTDIEQCHGKILLQHGIATPGAVRQAEELGAVAAIFINGKHTHEMIVSTVWGNPTPENKHTYPNIPVISINDEVGEKLKSVLPAKAQISTEVETSWRKIPTLIADIKGEVEPDKFVLFSGHVDSWHYGAMDNGGANATMLEVARVLKENDVKLRRSLRLAFWSGHSHGRYTGSAHYCDQHWEEIHDHCVAHVYIDSVGGKGANILGESNTMAEMKELGAKHVESLIGESFIGKRFGRGADQSFWGTGVPSLFMGLSEQPKTDDPASKTLVQIFGGIKSGGFGWWWHTTEDTMDKLDPENLARDCRVYASVIYDACTQALVPVNQLLAAEEIKATLLEYQKVAGERFNFTTSLERADQLVQSCRNLNEVLFHKNFTEESISSLNEGLMKVSRQLVPLNYVSGDWFDHDPAMNEPAIPSLAGISTLASVDIGTGEYFEWKTLLVRKQNKVNYILREAIQAIDSLLEKFK